MRGGLISGAVRAESQITSMRVISRAITDRAPGGRGLEPGLRNRAGCLSNPITRHRLHVRTRGMAGCPASCRDLDARRKVR